ncbi:ABC transporter ATP-binding protein [Kitasatospora sp. NPDC101801]|uniref:ABC transporter ATP-binding protein n=1 Tax=Kitasatospora sp. NPDC101801 TaxID=3364103 RepID=UPI003808C52B
MNVPGGGLLVVHGPAGSGRTSVLLALSGRMRLHTGVVRVGRHRASGAGAGRVRRLVAVARADGAVAAEGRLRVRELIAERCWLEPGVTRRRVVEAARPLGLHLRAATLIEDLPPLDALLLDLALALAAGPPVLAVDAVDRDFTGHDRDRAWQALAAVTATGRTVLSTTAQPPVPVPEGAVLLALPHRSTDLPADRTAHATPPAR